MNWFDVVMAFLFAGGLAGGYLQGMIRQSLSLASIICGLILATYVHVPLANWFAFAFPDVRAVTRETAAFLLSVLVLVSLLEVVQRRALPETHLLSLGPFDRIAGALVAAVTVSFQLGVAMMILRLLVSINWPIGDTVWLFLLGGIDSSLLARAFSNLVLALVVAVGRLLPEGEPRFLRLT
jgi:uncharacterized membrane protein required for colicin V production